MARLSPTGPGRGTSVAQLGHVIKKKPHAKPHTQVGTLGTYILLEPMYSIVESVTNIGGKRADRGT